MGLPEPVVELMSDFPDFKTPGFDMELYNRRFKEKNYVICARSNRIHYDKHWGCLSLKFALNGNEIYRTGNSTYSVNQSNFLILNLDTEYSSSIDTDTKVESFTLNFSEEYTNTFIAAVKAKTTDILDNNLDSHTKCPLFVERLYSRDALIFPVALKIHRRLNNFYQLNDEIVELFTELFCAMLDHREIINLEIGTINKAKHSTKQELYRRLQYARDFIDSCFCDPINLENIAQVACLNREYFIRQFHNYFKITPTQYLIGKRMEVAKHLLQTSEISISEVCHHVGYSDPSSFNKLFRRYFNISPSGLRIIQGGKAVMRSH